MKRQRERRSREDSHREKGWFGRNHEEPERYITKILKHRLQLASYPGIPMFFSKCSKTWEGARLLPNVWERDSRHELTPAWTPNTLSIMSSEKLPDFILVENIASMLFLRAGREYRMNRTNTSNGLWSCGSDTASMACEDTEMTIEVSLL